MDLSKTVVANGLNKKQPLRHVLQNRCSETGEKNLKKPVRSSFLVKMKDGLKMNKGCLSLTINTPRYNN